MTQAGCQREPVKEDVLDTAERFALSGRPLGIVPYGEGHIHQTFRLRMTEKGGPGYILQRINGSVFADVPAMMENIVRVTEHLRRRLAAIPGADSAREVLTVVPARDGAPYLRDEGGEYWRCFLFIDHRERGSRPGKAGEAGEAGRLYGRFLRLLADLPPPPLHETIPRFHDLQRRLADFDAAREADRAGRGRLAAAELEFVAARRQGLGATLAAARAAGLPLRVTHNDTKFNNVLFDSRGRGLCVIDLDTVMPGIVLNDFGDAIRSAANSGREDERELDRVRLQVGVFRDFAAGYLGELRGILEAVELRHLVFSARLMTFVIGLRFLTDHLDGDRYFRIRRPGHNLQRARVQFRLLEEMERQAAAMEGIVSELAVTS